MELSPFEGNTQDENCELTTLPEDHHAIVFSLRGELKALLIVCFEKDLDVSTYSELGNIIASRLALRLSEEAGIEVLISPPQPLSKAHLEMLPKLGSLVTQRMYRHFYKGQVAAIQTFLLANAASAEEHGNA